MSDYTERKTQLNAPEDWETWNRNFTTIAKSLNLWVEIRGRKRWQKPPVFPQEHTFRTELPPDPSAPATDAEGAAIRTPSATVVTNENRPLTRNEHTRYIDTITIYRLQHNQFTLQISNKTKLTEYINNTVSDSLKNNHYLVNEEIHH
ncbi:hypothetical protein PG994_004230 [Apiospora phragmitis]|uniref:Uncharacterized protein n=1 Tax=Apiospora phragmitis TaxID=2905665 RepID=A0ABR1VQ06_9PEZI